MSSARLFCPILTKFGLSGQIFFPHRNLQKIKFHETPSSWCHGDKRGQAETVGHGKADSSFSPKEL